DIHKLLEVLHGFVEAGNTVLVIEHNLDVIKTADWVIDLGPEGGADGGEVVGTGTPEELADNPSSYTGQALRDGPLGQGRRPSANGTKRADRRPQPKSAGRRAAEKITHLTVE